MHHAVFAQPHRRERVQRADLQYLQQRPRPQPHGGECPPERSSVGGRDAGQEARGSAARPEAARQGAAEHDQLEDAEVAADGDYAAWCSERPKSVGEGGV